MTAQPAGFACDPPRNMHAFADATRPCQCGQRELAHLPAPDPLPLKRYPAPGWRPYDSERDTALADLRRGLAEWKIRALNSEQDPCPAHDLELAKAAQRIAALRDELERSGRAARRHYVEKKAARRQRDYWKARTLEREAERDAARAELQAQREVANHIFQQRGFTS